MTRGSQEDQFIAVIIGSYEAMATAKAPVSQLANIERGIYAGEAEKVSTFLREKLFPAEQAFDQLVFQSGLTERIQSQLQQLGKPNYLARRSQADNTPPSQESVSVADIAVAAIRYIELAWRPNLPGAFEHSPQGNERPKSRRDFYLALDEAGLGEEIKNKLTPAERKGFEDLVELARQEKEKHELQEPQAPRPGISIA